MAYSTEQLIEVEEVIGLAFEQHNLLASQVAGIAAKLLTDASMAQFDVPPQHYEKVAEIIADFIQFDLPYKIDEL